MSDTSEAPIPLSVFLASLRPRKVATRTVTSRRANGQKAARSIDVFEPGDPKEIWSKLLTINHGHERHTPAQWHEMIDAYAKQPAHPADPRYQP